MSWASPHWLLLALPLALGWWWLRPGGRWLQGLRLSLLILIVLAMAEPGLRLPQRAGTVVVLADRSDSMPPDAAARQLEAVALLHESMSPEDRLAVVTFGRGVAVEQPPAVTGLPAFGQAVGGDASSLSAGLARALSLIPEDAGGRVLLLSDGRFTGPPPQTVALRAASRGVAVDYRELSRPTRRDLAILDVQAPESVGPGESFMISSWIEADRARRVGYELHRGQTLIAAGQREVPPGRSRLTFRDTATPPSGIPADASAPPRSTPAQADASLGYRLTVRPLADGGSEADASDPIPENNTAEFIVGVTQAKPLLLVTASPGRGLARLLNAGGLDVETRSPAEVDPSLQQLSGYSAIVLENVAATELPSGTLEQVAALVDTAGLGLLMTGGQRSFGPGGYFKSPLDPVLPISMELRQEHRKLSLAIAVALDRSGSMAMTVPGGRTKMDLANLGAAQVLDLLGPTDEIGVLAVDSAPHTILPLTPAVDKAGMRRRILSIDSMGGGIFVYPALAAATQMLASATPTTRHVILFADAQDAEEPGRYAQLLEKARTANITVSVIGLGQPGDVDAPLLRDVAQRGGGRSFFTDDPGKLPQLFAQDTFVVARSSFIDEATAVQSTGALAAITGRDFPDPPPVGGYNLNYLKPGASLAMVTADAYTAPLVASWHVGLGRVAVYTGEADGQFTGPIARWDRLGDLLSSLTRWIAAQDQRLPPDLYARQEVRDGYLHVELFLPPNDPGRLPRHPGLRVLLSDPADATAPPTLATPRMAYVQPDQLSASIPLQGRQVALATLDLGPLGRATLPPARLLYPPEFRPIDSAPTAAAGPAGRQTLRDLARLTAGQNRSDLSGLWQDLPARPRTVSLAPGLWLVGAVLLLLEILERRTALLSHLTARRQPARHSPPAHPSADTPDPAAPARIADRRRFTELIAALTTRRRRTKRLSSKPEASPATAPPADASSVSPAHTTGRRPADAGLPESPRHSLADALDRAKRQSDGRHRK